MQAAELKELNVTVLGSARSGMGAARLLASAGAKVLVSDLDPHQFSADKRQVLEEIKAEFEFGYHSPDVLNSDLVIVSPGIPDDSEIMQQLAEAEIPVFSEVELTSWFIHAPIIAVTGSNGKTTTVSLIHHLLKTAGLNSYLGGNVGQAISEVYLNSLEDAADSPIYVLEVSSFQLDHIDAFAPDIALLLNLSPDHLDRYTSLEAYYASKMRIFENQSFDDMAIINADDPSIDRSALGGSRVQTFSVESGADFCALDQDIIAMSERILPVEELPIPGPHNLSNALAAIAAVRGFIGENELLVKGLRSFKAVPHRLEYLGILKGMKFYNDSKATNVASTEVALKSFSGPFWPILGGKDKGSDYHSLIPLLRGAEREVLLVGDAASVIREQLGGDLKLHDCQTIDVAVDYALEHGSDGDVVLLSPACASFDQFEGFEARGNHFRELFTAKGGSR